MRVGLFGGTFDPIHNAHISIAEKLIETKMLEKIIFIPSALPPHKVQIPITSFFHRVNMIKLAIENRPYFSLSEIENTKLPSPSYTLETVKWFFSTFPEDDFSLIIGGDSLLQLHTWYKASELVNLCDIITYPRKNEEVKLELLKEFWTPELAEKLFKSLLPFPLYDVSATEIRIMLKENSSMKNFVPPKVYEYIKKHSLYR